MEASRVTLPPATGGAEVVAGEVPRRPRGAWIEWVRSGDHKRVGAMLIGAALAYLVVTLAALLLVRIHLLVSDSTILAPEKFNQVLTIYETLAFFFVLAPLAVGLATYLLPLQVGARAVALPRLAQVSFWLYMGGGLAILGSLLYDSPPAGGFVMPPPLTDTVFAPDNGANAWILGVGMAALGGVAAAINLIATASRLRGPGMAWRRVPVFTLGAVVGAWLLLVAGAVFAAGLVMLFVDREYNGVFFVPGEGGAPVLWQHLFWFYATSALFASLLAAFGAVSEIVPTFARRRLPGRYTVSACFGAIGVLAPLTWMTNMYSAPIPIGFEIAAMVFAALLAVPILMVFFNWVGSLWGGAVHVRAPLLFALGSVSLLSFGLASKLMLAAVPVGWALGKSAFATATLQFQLYGVLLGLLAGLYYWFPKITGRRTGEGLAKVSFWTILVGANLMLIPLFGAGLEGQAPDIGEYFGSDLEGYNLASSIGAFILIAGLGVSLANFAYHAGRGPLAGHDPWGGATLEWFALSPPPENNFDAVPDVTSPEPLLDIREAIGARPAPSPRTEPPAPAGAPLSPGAPAPEAGPPGEPEPSGPGDESRPVA